MAVIVNNLQKVIIDGVKFNTVKFDTINFGSLGYVVQTSPNYEFAETEVENTRIPGRNGDIVHFTGAYLNSSRTYVFIKKLSDTEDFRDHIEFYNAASELVAKLKSIRGYKILQDSFEPDVYRYAYVKEAGVVTNGLNQVMTIQVTFECKPQRFYCNSETYPAHINVDSDTYIINNITLFELQPVIKIEKRTGKSTTTLLIDNDENNSITINWDETHNYIIIDYELMDCYGINNDNLNALVNYVSSFPKIPNGTHTLSIAKTTDEIADGKIDYIEPGWWTL